MKRSTRFLIPVAMLLLIAIPAFAQGGQGTQAQAQAQTETPANDDSALILIRDRDQDNMGEGNENALVNQEQSEISKVVINKGEDDKLQVQTENASQERVRVNMDEGQGVLLEMQNQATGNQMQVRQENNYLYLKDGEVEARIGLPMEIDAETGEVVVITASGKGISLGEHPSQMLTQLIEDGVINGASDIELIEDETVADQVQYRVTGTDARKFLALFEVNAPVQVEYDAETGEVLETIQPWYMRWFGFLYTNV